MTSGRTNTCEVAVVGAGPYGLSVAAHLEHAGVAVHVFGEPMAFWRHNMPKGMLLRSPWRATDLSDPDGKCALDVYASAHDVDRTRRLPLEKFVAYGEWFQRQAVPDVDRRAVRLIEATGNGFRLQLEDGDNFNAGRIVIATGLCNQEYRPSAFAGLPPELVSHTSQHADLSIFGGKHVAVVGRGQSACETAALLSEAGAAAEIVSRGDIRWLGISANPAAVKPLQRRLRQALTAPSEVGPFPLSWLVEVPGLVRLLPNGVRAEFSRRCLKAAASGWLKPRFTKVVCNPGHAITGARVRGNGIAIDLDNATRIFDHVVLGTGYRIDIARLGILAPSLLERIGCVEGSPLLGAGFESSVPRLHFVGSYAVRSFGPLLRFIAGAPYAARSVAAATLRRRAAPMRADLVPAEKAEGMLGAAIPNLWPPQ